MRMCAPVDGSRLVSGSDAREWDTAVPAAGMQLLGHKPAQWFPLQRDWANIALFKSVTTNTAFPTGTGVDKLTDGWFDREALSAAPRIQPYAEIDLGSVRDISNIRIFPAAGDAIDLKGFRIYASRTPMAVSGIPGGSGITTYAPETEDAVSYDRWNVWTRNPAQPSEMLRARFIRLQNPDPQAVSLRRRDPGIRRHPSRSAAVPAGRMRPDCRRRHVQGTGLEPGHGKVCRSAGARRPALEWLGNLAVTASRRQLQRVQQLRQFAGSRNLGDRSGRCKCHQHMEPQFGKRDPERQRDKFRQLDTGRCRIRFQGRLYRQVMPAPPMNSQRASPRGQNTTYWGTGPDIGGAIGGFTNTSLAYCRYRPRPYAYRLPERSDTGYLHVAYAVDYIVQEGSTGMWKRANVPAVCSGDRIFADGFD
jgi:hypothetical protein